jgi:hypothetical protein
MALHLSGFTPSGFQDVRRQEVSHLGFLGAETPKHQTLTCSTISGFPPSGFRDVRRQEVSHLGFPGAEIPKYNNFSTPYFLGLRKSGFRDLRVQGKLTLGSSGFRKAKMPNQITLCQFRIPRVGFRILELAIQEAKLHAPRLPECRKSDTPAHHTLDQIRGFAVKDFATSGYKGTYP